MHLVEEGRDADVFRPFHWRPSGESDTRSQNDAPLQIVNSVGRYAHQREPMFHDNLHGHRLRSDEAADVSEDRGIISHRAERRTAAKATAEKTDRHASCVFAGAD